MSDPILQARSLHRSFQSGEKTIEVLRGVDFTLSPGESASIQGESGSGKSTLLNHLAGLDRPDSGAIFWQNVDISGFSIEKRARVRGSLIGMVFQAYYLVPELRALENVMLGGRISGQDGDLKARSLELLKRVGLEDRASSLPATLSGGERQRVAIARAMVSQPKILLADEPTGNLDEATGDAVMHRLRSLCVESNVALVLVTHNRRHAEALDQTWVMKHGKLEKL